VKRHYAGFVEVEVPLRVLVNPSAARGRARALIPEIERALDGRRLDHRIVLTTGLEHGREQARAAAEAGEIVVVASGDGLIGQVGGELAGTQSALGIIPAGRGNDLARVLGIPTEIQSAVDLIATGATRLIDVGEANGRRFLGIASCGFDSDANRIANEARWIRGRLVYAYAALRALATWKPATFTLELDGRREQVTGYTVAAANNKTYGGGMMAAPDAELDDGLLDVGATGNVGRLRFLQGLSRIFEGEHIETLEVRVWRVPEVRIEADRPFRVYADGDPITDLPAKVSVLPRALRVIAPQQ
jgi:YegS/Rv2252/BmrU family lipid kinase